MKHRKKSACSNVCGLSINDNFMPHEAKNFEHLIGLAGFSDKLLNNHLALYQGYVANVNNLTEEFRKLSENNSLTTPQFAELKRRFGWEWNGMRLHQYYFGNLTKEKNGPDEASAFQTQIKKDFGNFENWQKEFKAVGAMRGIGWVILYYDPMSGELINVWINEHDEGHPAGAIPVMVMDVFEHAYVLDYGMKRADYIEAFFNAIDWKVVEKRYDWATKVIESKPKELDHFGCRC